MSIQKFYFHDASASGGTLPNTEHSAQSATKQDATATTARTMTASAGSSQASATFTLNSSASAQRSWFRTFVSAPLAAQTIGAGNWQLSAAASEGNADSNLHLTCVIYAWRPSTGAVVGSLVSDFLASTGEPTGTNAQIAINDTTIAGTAVDILDGDVLVCEIWRDATVPGATGRANTFFYDGTTEASATNCASFLLAPVDIYVSGEVGPTFSRTTGYPQGAGAGANDTVAIALNPGSAVGDSLYIYVLIGSNTITSTGVSSSRSTGWTKIKSFNDSTATLTMEIWQGTITSTGTHTVTVTYSASVAAVFGEIDADSYHSSRTSPVWWSAVQGGQHDTAATTFNMPTLTPSINGAQAYIGLASPANGAQAGTTPEYTYTPLDSTFVTVVSKVGVSGSQTPNVTQSSSGTASVVAAIISDAPISGTGSIGLKKPSLAGTGSSSGGGTDSGTGSVALKKPALSIAAKEKISGTGSAALKKPSISVAAKEKYVITGSVSLKKPALSVAAKEKYIITGSVALKKPALSESGKETISGTGSVSLKKPSLFGNQIAAQTLFDQPSSPATIVSDTAGYTLAMEFYVSEEIPFTGVWFYSEPSASQLPTWAGLYRVSDQAQLAANHPDPGWSGGVGDGWVKSTFDGSIILDPAEHYRVFVYGPGGVGNWYTATSHYWLSGPGSADITNGVITAPSNAHSSGGQDSYNADTVAYPASSFNESNYWVDVEVGSAPSIDEGSGSVSLHKPSLSASGTEKISGTGSVALKKPALSIAAKEKISGTGSAALKKPALSVAAKEKESGSGSVSLKKPSISIAAKERYILTGGVGLKKPALSGSGPAEKVSGTGSVSLKKPQLFIFSSNNVSGTGSISLKKPALSVSAKEKISGTGSCGLKKPGISGSVREKINGTGHISVKKPSLTLAGKEKETGTGSVSLKKPALSGSGTAHPRTVGTGSIALKKPVLTISAREKISGTGSVTIHKPHIVSTIPGSEPASSLFIFSPV